MSVVVPVHGGVALRAVVSSGGRVSVIVTLMPVDGPLFVALSVNVSVSPGANWIRCITLRQGDVRVVDSGSWALADCVVIRIGIRLNLS